MAVVSAGTAVVSGAAGVVSAWAGVVLGPPLKSFEKGKIQMNIFVKGLTYSVIKLITYP